MGLFDKAKGFFGGKGMADVLITVIEGQAADGATFPVTDSVLKGTMVITAKQACTLLATKYELSLRIPNETGSDIDHYVTSEKDPDPNTSYDDSCLKLPCDMTPGQVIEQPWMISDVDLPKALKDNGFADANAATQDPKVKLVVKCIADVKGSPFDPSAETIVRMLPGS